MLKTEKCFLVVVDVQGKLARLMHNKESLFANIQILIKAAKILQIPILWCQQVPHALGPTLPEIAELLEGITPIDKAAFSCYGDDSFKSELEKIGRTQAILCGIETHVCIYQTASDLLDGNYDVTIIADAVSSRTEANKQLALDKMRYMRADINTTEMALFELLKTAKHPNFREIAKLIK